MDKPDDILYGAIATSDGTITLRDPITGELYHNSAGAYLEAMENYVRPSMPAQIVASRVAAGESPRLALLDVCFGLGYNSFSLIDFLASNNFGLMKLEVFAIETDRRLLPVIAKVAEQSCFPSFSNCFVTGSANPPRTLSQILSDVFADKPGDNACDNLELSFAIGSMQVDLHIVFEDLRQVIPRLARERPRAFDLVYHDPFSATKVPELWTVDLFLKYNTLLNQSHGRVLTYSIATAVRGGFLQAGFLIYRTRAVGRKNGGTLAIVRFADSETSSLCQSELVYLLDEEERAKLASRSSVPYRDDSFFSE
ncbi:MAG: hypothetical protein K8F91_23830, partial [Candidatus Obscuribacterales bacterium]|nr:hypothetical protein [Candidatus Obscuribacterales bacterium]